MREGSAVVDAHGAAAARSVDLGDAYDVAGTDADAAGAVVRDERGEQLHDLAVDVHGDEPVAVGVEAGHGARVVLDGALEGRGRVRLEAKEEAPDRADEQRLEGGGPEDCGAQPPGLAERLGEQPA